jgi:hypothetical protein
MGLFNFLSKTKQSDNTDERLWDSSRDNFYNNLMQRFTNPTAAKVNVTSEGGFTVSPYWAAVRAISEDATRLTKTATASQSQTIHF